MISRLTGIAARLIGAVIVLWTGACTAVGPDYQPPAGDVPEQWESSQEGTVVTGEVRPEWWRSFNDPQLTGVVEAAGRSNKSLAQARARVQEARALRDVAASALFPSIAMGGSVLRETLSENGRLPVAEIPVLKRHQTVFEAGFDAAWEADVFGGRRRQVEAADARAASVVEAERAARVTVLAETARNYLELRGMQRQRAIVEKNAGLQRQTMELTGEKFDAGLGTELDVARAEAQLRATEARLPNLDAEIAAATYRLAVLTGQRPGQLLKDLLQQKPLPAPPDLVPVGLPSDLLRRRPDVRRAERELAAATADIGVAVAELFPKFSLTGTAGREALSFGDLFQAGSGTSRLGPQIRWPIFQNGRIRSMVAAAEARAQAAAAAYEEAVLNALSETETALERYGRELQTRQKLEVAVAVAERAADLAEQRYDAGLGTLFEVLDAQSRVLGVESDLVRSETAVVLDLTVLYKALGGGWERTPK